MQCKVATHIAIAIATKLYLARLHVDIAIYCFHIKEVICISLYTRGYSAVCMTAHADFLGLPSSCMYMQIKSY